MKKLILILLFIPLVSFGQNENLTNSEKEPEVSFAIIEDVPLFPGCETVPKSKRRECFQNKMNRHIIQNFRYPDFAIKNGIQGIVFVQFIIEKDGNVSGIRSRGPHGSLERAAKKNYREASKNDTGLSKRASS